VKKKRLFTIHSAWASNDDGKTKVPLMFGGVAPPVCIDLDTGKAFVSDPFTIDLSKPFFVELKESWAKTKRK
jgi:hypothetical protein